MNPVAKRSIWWQKMNSVATKRKGRQQKMISVAKNEFGGKKLTRWQNMNSVAKKNRWQKKRIL